jgi:hypothetical protein
MSAPAWTEVLPSPPPGAQLDEAWMTSFEPPDAALLVEHVLPSLLGIAHVLSEEPTARTMFFGELGSALEALHGRLTVVSSPARVPLERSAYPWLWRYVSAFTVGATSTAVQHAKLWAFHWRTVHEELLELHVSSTNLTASAFKAQMQAGWRVRLVLGSRPTEQVRRTWGDLVPFLETLGESAGRLAAERVGRLLALLGRVECPAEVTFIASVPRKRGGARKLRLFEPTELHVLTPSIGDWTEQTTAAWCDEAGLSPGRVHLKWIPANHPWATAGGFALSTRAKDALEGCGVKLECLPNAPRLAAEHRDADPRWSHAKLYLLRSRRKRRLLVTSANFSVAAWGVGNRPPKNFELGVLFECEWDALERLGEPFDPPRTTAFCADASEPEERESPLEWAEASWDGYAIELRARSTDVTTPIAVSVAIADGTQVGSVLTSGHARMPWADPRRTPVTAAFCQGAERLEVAIVDIRTPAEFARTPLPELDLSHAEAIREAFILQRYGGPAVDSDSIGDKREAVLRAPASSAADYSVQAWTDARTAFAVLDGWRSAHAASSNDRARRARIRQDGEELRRIFARRGGPAFRLTCEEFRWRLEEDE